MESSNQLAAIGVYPGVDPWSTWGPVSLGAMFACILQGYIYAMTINYFSRYANKDRWPIRSTIILLTFLTTAETVLVMTKSLRQTVINTGDVFYVLALSTRPDEYILAPLTNFSITVCQAFLCWRFIRFARAMRDAYGRWVWRGTVLLGGIMVVLFALSLVGSVFLPIRLSQATNLLVALQPSASPDQLSFWFYWCFAIFVIIDVIIVLATTVQHRAARTGFAESNTILNVIVNLTLRNGMVILAFQIAELALFPAHDAGAWVLFPHAFISRIYAITVLSTLTLPRDAQKNIRQKQADEEKAMSLSNSAAHPNHPNYTARGLNISMNPSQTSTRCVSCGVACGVDSLYGGKGGLGGRGSLGSRYRGSTGAGAVGELGVTLSPKEHGFAESEGPVSFGAALFGLHEEGSEGKGSPEIGVDTVGYSPEAVEKQEEAVMQWEGGDEEMADMMVGRARAMGYSLDERRRSAVTVPLAELAKN